MTVHRTTMSVFMGRAWLHVISIPHSSAAAAHSGKPTATDIKAENDISIRVHTNSNDYLSLDDSSSRKYSPNIRI